MHQKTKKLFVFYYFNPPHVKQTANALQFYQLKIYRNVYHSETVLSIFNMGTVQSISQVLSDDHLCPNHLDQLFMVLMSGSLPRLIELEFGGLQLKFCNFSKLLFFISHEGLSITVLQDRKCLPPSSIFETRKSHHRSDNKGQF